MTPLEQAFRSISDLLRTDVRPHVERVGLDSKGRITVTALLEGRTRWFRLRGQDLAELQPGADAKLPLARGRCAQREADLEVLSYRPGRRIVLLDRRGDRPEILKGYRRGASAAASAAHRRAMEVAEARSFLVPRLLSHHLPGECVRFEYHGGAGLDLSESQAETLFRIGAFLREFQDAGCGEGRAVFGAREELAVLERTRERAQRVMEYLPEGWVSVERCLDQVADRLPKNGAVHAHRDLHDGQFLISESGIALIDFDLLTLADVALDPANLTAHLFLRAIQGIRGATQDAALALGEAFLEGLHRNEDPSFWIRLRYYQATTLLRLALIYSLRPRWSHVVPELVQLAHRCSAEVQSDTRSVS